MTAPSAPFLTRLRIEDYKSVAHCDIRLGAFNVLFGLNAAGKSNVLDAVRFLRDALSLGPAEAAQERGGWDAVLRRVPTPANTCTIALEFRTAASSFPNLLEPLDGLVEGAYEVSFSSHGAVRERCEIAFPGGEAPDVRFFTDGGVVFEPGTERPLGKVRPGALYLPLAGTTEPYDRLYSALTSMFFHTPDLAALRDARPPTGADTLAEDGGQLGEVIARMADWERDRVSAYMGAIVPRLTSVGPESVDVPYIAATMTMDTDGGGGFVRFGAESMSEGTIRALGQLAALYQPPARDGRIPLVAIEEPELALHPLAAGVLFDALTEASETVQILATSQSAELFDRKEADLDSLLVAVARDGVTSIGPVDAVGRSVVADGLATVGELLRSDQLNPDLGEDIR
ncbi:AAA family ATPase [Streptomyces sodiiphilus]|uniref:AAA family ATPase n=1 Tax=Streptomyces sodiiphilus TaxID=226217 RepID=A0ABN2NRR3_9ACTN